MTYQEIFNTAKERLMKSGVSGFDNFLAVQVDIIGEGEGAFYIELKDGKLSVEPYEYYDHHVKLIATGDDFLKIADGSMNAVMAYTIGKLRIEGDLGKALELQDIIETIKKNEKAQVKAEKKASKKIMHKRV